VGLRGVQGSMVGPRGGAEGTEHGEAEGNMAEGSTVGLRGAALRVQSMAGLRGAWLRGAWQG